MQPARLLSAVVPFAILIALPALAQPSVTATEGVVVPGETLRIHGAGFGAKSPAAPLLAGQPGTLDLAEGDPIPTRLTGCADCAWLRAGPHDGAVTYSTATGLPSYHVQGAGYLMHADLDEPGAERLYVSWRVRPSRIPDREAYCRLLRIRTRYDDQSSSVTLTPDLLVVTGDEDHDGQPESPRYLPADLHLTPYEWTHLELAVDSGPDITTGGGTVTVWADGALIARAENCWANEPLDQLAILGFHPGRTELTEDVVVDIAGVYLDTSFARVVLADMPQRENATQAVLQTPVAWSDGAITVTVDTGSFTTGETVWLFVADAHGDWSHQGWELCVGEGEDLGPPGPPGLVE